MLSNLNTDFVGEAASLTAAQREELARRLADDIANLG